MERKIRKASRMPPVSEKESKTMGTRFFIIDDEQDFVDSIKRSLIQCGYKDITPLTDSLAAADFFHRGNSCDIAIIDVDMPNMNGIELLKLIKCHSPHTECIMITALNEARLAVECLKKGAYDYLVKPVTRDDLLLRIQHAQERKRLYDIIALERNNAVPHFNHPEAFASIITKSLNMIKILKEAELHACSDVPILISGESGTGKELLARAIHAASLRKDLPFMPVNMVSINANLFDAEFFGHTKGAFTGAVQNRAGYLEYAHRGTLFLDEIGSLPLELQGKLLRVLQEGEFTKIGNSQLQKADIRFVAATNSDLDKMVARGQFRKDFFYRLKGAWLHLPPLRERKEDISLLVDQFLKDIGGSSAAAGIEGNALSLLMDYEYPGNIRELRSILQGSINLAQGGPITADLLPESIRRVRPAAPKTSIPPIPLRTLAEVEKEHIIQIYRLSQENKSESARMLGIGLNTLRRKLQEYSIEN